jgi:hypothetical protein
MLPWLLLVEVAGPWESFEMLSALFANWPMHRLPLWLSGLEDAGWKSRDTLTERLAIIHIVRSTARSHHIALIELTFIRFCNGRAWLKTDMYQVSIEIDD